MRHQPITTPLELENYVNSRDEVDNVELLEFFPENRLVILVSLKPWRKLKCAMFRGYRDSRELQITSAIIVRIPPTVGLKFEVRLVI